MSQPKLSDLMARFLGKQTAAQAAGLGLAPAGEVVPHDGGPVQPVDPQAAWTAATAVLFSVDGNTTCTAPSQWAQLVAAHEPEVALAFCLGNYPQLMRSFHTILHKAKLSDLRPNGSRALGQPGLVDWANQTIAKGRYPEALVAAACLRLANEFGAAETALRDLESKVPDAWRPALDNEHAALAWHAGHAKEALALWLSQPVTAANLFNRGMAALFLDRPSDAIEPLNRAIAQLPDTSSWHHLGRLYLVLAKERE